MTRGRETCVRYPDDCDCLYDYASVMRDDEGMHLRKTSPDYIDGHMLLAEEDAWLLEDYIVKEVVMDDYDVAVCVKGEDYDDFAGYFMGHTLPLVEDGLVVEPGVYDSWTMGVVVAFDTPRDLRRVTGPVEKDYIYTVVQRLEGIVDDFFAAFPGKEKLPPPPRWGTTEEEDD